MVGLPYFLHILEAHLAPLLLQVPPLGPDQLLHVSEHVQHHRAALLNVRVQRALLVSENKRSVLVQHLGWFVGI